MTDQQIYMIAHSTIPQFHNSRNKFLGLYAPNFIEMTFLEEIQTLIFRVHNLIDQILIGRYKKKRCEKGFDILEDFV